MATWMPIGLDEDDRDGAPTRFIMHNDVDTWVLRQMQGAGVSVVQLEPRPAVSNDQKDNRSTVPRHHTRR